MDAETGVALPQTIDPDSSEPSYRQLARILSQQIVNNHFPPGTKMPKEREFAVLHNVGRVTVRNALSLLEMQGLVRRVRGRGTFAAPGTQAGRWFSTASTILLRHMATDLEDSRRTPQDGYYGGILTGARRMARDFGLDVRLEALSGKILVPLRDYNPPRPSHVAGVILCGTSDESYIGMFLSEGVPLVVVDYWTQNLETDCVAVDIDAEAWVAVRHLVEAGHTSLGFVAKGRQDRDKGLREFDPDIWRLLDNLRRATQRARMEMRDEWIILGHSGLQLKESMQQFLSLRARPTAVMCFDEMPAQIVLEAIDEAHLRCPEDISVIARGAATIAGRHVTTFLPHAELIGQIAVKMLVERLRGKRETAVKVGVSCRFVRGTTLGPAPRDGSTRIGGIQ